MLTAESSIQKSPIYGWTMPGPVRRSLSVDAGLDVFERMVDACKVALVEMHVVNFKDLPDHLKDLVEGDEWKTDTTSK